jgi:hypothetical protein
MFCWASSSSSASAAEDDGDEEEAKAIRVVVDFCLRCCRCPRPRPPLVATGKKDDDKEDDAEEESAKKENMLCFISLRGD